MKFISINKLQHPVFIISIALLIINDFYFKQTFGNAVTGKLSDFTGLFAFPFFLSCLFPSRKKTIHIFTCFIFIWWKSIFSQPFIDFANYCEIPLVRTVDFTDNIALVSVAFSYFLFSKENKFRVIRPIWQFFIITLSAFSFMATSLAPRTRINYISANKVYKFDIPMETLITRLNTLQKKEIEKRPYLGTFDEETGVFFSNNEYKDTLAYIIDITKYTYEDTIFIKNYFSDILIYRENDNITILKLINIAISESSHKKEVQEIDSMNIHSVDDNRYGYPIRSYAIVPMDTINENKLQKKDHRKNLRG